MMGWLGIVRLVGLDSSLSRRHVIFEKGGNRGEVKLMSVFREADID